MKLFLRIKTVLLVVLIAYSCIPAYRVYKNPLNTPVERDQTEKLTVYVKATDSIKKELKVMKYADLFEFTDDSLHPKQLIVSKLESQPFPCGNPMIGSMITLGMLPSELPDRYIYNFAIVEDEKRTQYSYTLNVSTRYWFWNIFSNKKNFKKQLGKALKQEFNGS